MTIHATRPRPFAAASFSAMFLLAVVATPAQDAPVAASRANPRATLKTFLEAVADAKGDPPRRRASSTKESGASSRRP